MTMVNSIKKPTNMSMSPNKPNAKIVVGPG